MVADQEAPAAKAAGVFLCTFAFRKTSGKPDFFRNAKERKEIQMKKTMSLILVAMLYASILISCRAAPVSTRADDQCQPTEVPTTIEMETTTEVITGFETESDTNSEAVPTTAVPTEIEETVPVETKTVQTEPNTGENSQSGSNETPLG